MTSLHGHYLNPISAEVIKEIRLDFFDLSQRHFAQLLGVSENTVNRWERGHCECKGPAAKLLVLVVNYETIKDPKGPQLSLRQWLDVFRDRDLDNKERQP